MRTIFDNTCSKSSDVHEGEFVFFEINKFTYLVHSLKTITATAVSCSKVSERQGSVRKKALESREPARSDNILCK